MSPYTVPYFGDFPMHVFQASHQGQALEQRFVHVFFDSDQERAEKNAAMLMEAGKLAVVPNLPEVTPQFIQLALGFLTADRKALGFPAAKQVWSPDPAVGALMAAMILEDPGFLDENVVRALYLPFAEIETLIESL